MQDLVNGHLLALRKLLGLAVGETFCRAYNLGTGKGYSVLDMVKTFEQVNGVKVPYRMMPRRDGDVASCWADAGRAREELGWEPQKDLSAMTAGTGSVKTRRATGNKYGVPIARQIPPWFCP